jgi:alpha-glucosidase (family GH31 glycosyl hydrolase)
MKKQHSRRRVLQGAAAACAALLLPQEEEGAEPGLRVAGQDVEIQIASVSEHTARLTVFPLKNLREDGQVMPVTGDGSLVQTSWGPPLATLRSLSSPRSLKTGNLKVRISSDPIVFKISSAKGVALQQLKVDRETGVVSFTTGNAPLLGLGEGGPQFDRRGSIDRMVSGQGGYRLRTHGGRVPIPWIIGTAGWAMYVHQPLGTFDFTGVESRFLPASPAAALPLDIFFVAASDPATIMAEYARLTGYAEMPPLWSFGYQQSHRTLANREEIIAEAKTFREKKLPCDTLIYLGTGFCPSGWNTENGSFTWNSRVFPDPKEIIDELHKENFRTALHVVIKTDKLSGTVHDPCEPGRVDATKACCHWEEHRKDFAMGVDGWWPDEGDQLDIASRLVRNRMYWEGPQLERPNERPFALHRNGYAGMQRYASFLWSGDVYSTWETLKVHIPIAINTALTGIPYWGTDIGGFVPTNEFTAELYLRWFQFASFCPLFRSHGRTWKLRLPWGWNTGDAGPIEINNYNGAAIPEESQLHNPQVEPICRKYLELRYRMLPYLYSAVRECATTGMPILRALWLHYPDDPKAVACQDEYLWGRDLLVAPVVEQGTTSRNVYLPRGAWYDFWTGERVQGETEINRKVDLETTPFYVRAGAILPLGPVKQYVGEKVDQPLSLTIYPGADGSFTLYEDDGSSFSYRKGEWMGIQMVWHDGRRVLRLSLASGSRVLPPLRRGIEVKLGQVTRAAVFDGHPVEVFL